ncbi:helix-turn-helix transcriptional regulator [Ruegeria sp. HKCCD7255]|uniref:ArsR/SmtB family transcription factor n=1 Tax=Ruegeria sp. HKCCD7255 TaxID=2683004 RepID=UPI001489D952|nr:metalloregulator ArsR/SmtB family transcription factor [Ruegeria sp. HKCCD7255]
MTYEKALSALGDTTRRHVFEAVARKPQSVGQIAADMPVSRPAVSQHLRVLSDAGLVMCQAQGTRRIYTACPDGLDALRSWLDRYWSEVMSRFADEVNSGKEDA